MTARTFLIAFFIFGLGFRLGRLAVVILQARARSRGRTTAPAMFHVMTVSYFIFLAFCGREGFTRLSTFSWIASGVGLVLYIAALALRERAMSELGRFFSPDIEIRVEHKLVREGLYRYLRHPLLACMAVEIIGLGLVFNAYRTLILFGVGFYFPLIVIRKTIEEKALLQALGDSYRVYQNEVGAFWPKINGLHITKGESHV